MTLPLVYLYDELKAAGLPVIIGNPGWETYGRPYPFEVRGSIAHHTASPLSSSASANRYVVVNGNSIAVGPIAHCLLQRSLTLEVIAAGRCNHGGAGWWPLGKDNANQYGFAVEAVNNGVGEYWQSEFVEIMARTYALVHTHEGAPVNMAWTHAAYAPTRKIDPAGPAAFRSDRPGTWTNAEWQSLIRHYATKPTPTGDDMAELRRVENSTATLIVSGATCTWVLNGDDVDVLIYAGFVKDARLKPDGSPNDIPFFMLRMLTLIGPVGAYSVEPGRDQEVTASHFQAHVT